MKALFLVLLLVTSYAFAKPDWQDPNAKYSSSNNMTDKTTVTIKNVSDVQAVCEKESKARGNGGFGFGVEACSFWEGRQCTIVLPKRFTKEMLGHEMLHCIQGSFH